MAKGRHINSNARGVDPNAVAFDQDSFGGLAASESTEIDMDLAQQVGEGFAQAFLGGDPKMTAAIPSVVKQLASQGGLQELEGLRRGLELIEAQRPGAAMEIITAAGSPESLVMDFGRASEADSLAAAQQQEQAAASRKNFKAPPLERITTYGAGKRSADGSSPRIAGLEKLTEEEGRSRDQRVSGGAEKGSWQFRHLLYSLNPELYRAARKDQLSRMGGIEITPEMVASLNPRQAAGIFAQISPGATLSSPEQLIGMQLTPEAADFLTRAQRDQLVGPINLQDLLLENTALENEGGRTGSRNAQSQARRATYSARDQKIAGMQKHAREGTAPTLDDWFKWWRYQWPTVLPGQSEIIRPDTPPSGDLLARLSADTLGLRGDLPDWVTTMTPVFDRAVREQYATPPKSEIYRGVQGRTALDFARMQLDPAYGGLYLKQAAESGWPFPQFIEGLSLNRGPKDPINLGGLLLDDTISAPQPDPTINTPDEVPPPVAPEAPPVMPSDGDVSMYDPRMQRMNPSILAALLA